MADFEGFTGSSKISIPSNFFSEILPNITDLYELKIVLIVFQLMDRSEDPFPFFLVDDLLDRFFPAEENKFSQGLALAVEHGWILLAEIVIDQQKKSIGFLNNTRGQAGIEAIQNGTFTLAAVKRQLTGRITQPPDIFKTYEENIGLITPIIADSLKDLEATYTPEWVTEAIQTAVKNNARNLRYIEVVLQNWQEEGKHVGTDRRRRKKTSEQYDPEGYTDGEFSDFIDH